MQADPSACIGMSMGGASPLSSPQQNNANADMEDTVACDICLPFHILVYYMRNSKCMLSPCEKSFLDDVIVMSFNSLCIDAKFVMYLINESDFIEIVMGDIASSLDSLPTKLDPKDVLGNFNVVKQLENVSPLLL